MANIDNYFHYTTFFLILPEYEPNILINMIKFEQALEIVLSHTLEVEKELIPLSDAMGRILSDNIFADRDMPPFNKSAVDGYACREEDLGEELRVMENIPAGYYSKLAITAGFCSKIMTGAKLPEGADTVIMVEDVIEKNDRVKYVTSDGEKTKNNICLKGEDLKEGDLVLEKGTLIKPEQIAILAAMGVTQVPASKPLRIGLLSTGDEIVEPETTPNMVQIRNSNGWQLRAQILKSGAIANYYGIIADNEQSLGDAIKKALYQNDILILTGGVSVGDFDFVPSIIRNLGLEIIFDKIAVQPGKPSTFAIKRSSGCYQKTEKVVFALPGNPVSCYIQFELLIKPFVFKSMGAGNPILWFEMASAQDYKRKHTKRKVLIPVKVGQEGRFTIVSYNGSAHIVALNKANAVAEIPEGVSDIKAGDKLRIFFLQ
ncbi:MAG: gephyrin-like molybdotransferase Glp [Rikenellaceae bacterium]